MGLLYASHLFTAGHSGSSQAIASATGVEEEREGDNESGIYTASPSNWSITESRLPSLFMT